MHQALEAMDIKSSKNEEFVLENILNTEIIILTCISNLEFLVNSAGKIFLDETFKCCPKFIYQVTQWTFFPLVYISRVDQRKFKPTELCGIAY